MSNLKDYNALLAKANALDNSEAKKPYIPVGIYLQEAEDLYHWCLDDMEELKKAGLSEALVKELPMWVGAASEAQSLWMKEMKTREKAEQQWAEQSPQAYNLRDELLHAFRYAFRNNGDILNQLSVISDGTGHADMIQDLNDLAVLGRDNPLVLKGIGLEEEKIVAAATLSDTMRDLRARANGERYEDSNHLTIRNKMYTMLKMSVDEIRQCGKYVFWHNADRLKGYASRYLRKHKWSEKAQKEESSDDAL